MRIHWLPLLLGLPAGAAHAGEAEPVTLGAKLEHRYDVQPGERHRIQQALTVSFTADLAGFLTLAGKGFTGSKYSTRWDTLYDFREPSEGLQAPEMHLRQVWAEAEAGPLRVQAGAIPPFKESISRITLAYYGWIDGARAELTAGPVVVELVGGRLGDFDTPGVIERERRPNFAELELTATFTPVWGAELGGEVIDGVPWVKGEVSADLSGWKPHLPRLAVECLYDTGEGAPAVDLSAGVDVLPMLVGEHPKRLKARVNYTYIDPDVGPRARQSDDFDGTGHIGTVKLKGLILEPWGLGWFTRWTFSDDPVRVVAGFVIDVSS